jgi:hypothetical protein
METILQLVALVLAAVALWHPYEPEPPEPIMGRAERPQNRP